MTPPTSAVSDPHPFPAKSAPVDKLIDELEAEMAEYNSSRRIGRVRRMSERGTNRVTSTERGTGRSMDRTVAEAFALDPPIAGNLSVLLPTIPAQSAKRYFVLEPPFLFMYASSAPEERIQGWLDLRNGGLMDVPDATLDLHGFEVAGSNRSVWTLFASNESIKSNWMSKIEGVITQTSVPLKHHPEQPTRKGVVSPARQAARTDESGSEGRRFASFDGGERGDFRGSFQGSDAGSRSGSRSPRLTWEEVENARTKSQDSRYRTAAYSPSAGQPVWQGRPVRSVTSHRHSNSSGSPSRQSFDKSPSQSPAHEGTHLYPVDQRRGSRDAKASSPHSPNRSSFEKSPSRSPAYTPTKLYPIGEDLTTRPSAGRPSRNASYHRDRFLSPTRAIVNKSPLSSGAVDASLIPDVVHEQMSSDTSRNTSLVSTGSTTKSTPSTASPYRTSYDSRNQHHVSPPVLARTSSLRHSRDTNKRFHPSAVGPVSPPISPLPRPPPTEYRPSVESEVRNFWPSRDSREISKQVRFEEIDMERSRSMPVKKRSLFDVFIKGRK